MSKQIEGDEFSENTPKNEQKAVKTDINPVQVPLITHNGDKIYKKPVSAKSLSNLKPFPKGVTGNPAGKPVGTKSTKGKQWEVLHESIAGTHTERFNKVLATLDDKEFMDNYLRILEYFKPRLQRAENINANVELDKVVLNLNGDMAIDLPSNFDETDTERGGVGDFVNEELPNEDENNVENEPE
jgi:hypothetical protein